jgi:hypothetical protein
MISTSSPLYRPLILLIYKRFYNKSITQYCVSVAPVSLYKYMATLHVTIGNSTYLSTFITNEILWYSKINTIFNRFKYFTARLRLITISIGL